MSVFVTLLFMLFYIVGFVTADEEFHYDAKGKRDPFIPLVSKNGTYFSDAYGIKSIEDVRLEGIVWDDKTKAVAIINGEIVREGMTLGPVKVLKIEKDAVIFDVNGEDVRIELKEEF